VLAAPLENVRRTLAELVTVLSATAVAATAVLATVAWAALRAGIRPYDHMIDTVNAVADGNLSHRAELVTGDARVARLGGAVDDMLDRIEAAISAQEVSETRLKDFLAAASHELRTPLTSVRGYADLYLSGAASDPDDTRRAMQRISAEAQRMADVVEDLLTLARLDQHRPFEQQPVDLLAVIDDSVTDLRAA
jgi:two-component system, OmpR family, sensor kinase